MPTAAKKATAVAGNPTEAVSHRVHIARPAHRSRRPIVRAENSLEEAELAAGHGANFWASQFLEHRDLSVFVRAANGFSADQDQFAGMRWVARRIGHCDLASEGGSQDNRVLDAERVAEGADIITPLRQRASVATAVATVIQVDDLGAISQARVGRLVNREKKAGAAMQEQQCRLLSHYRPVRYEARTLNVKEGPCAIYEYAHELIFQLRPIACSYKSRATLTMSEATSAAPTRKQSARMKGLKGEYP